MSTLRVDFRSGGIRDVEQAFRSVLQATLAAHRAAEASAREQERAHRRLAQEAERLKWQEVRAAERAERAKVLAADRGAREQNRAYEALVRETEKWERDRTRIVEAAAQARARAEQKAFKEGQDRIKAANEQYTREMHERRDAQLEERARSGLRGRLASGVYGGLANAMQAGGQYAREAAGVATGVFGGFSIADSVKKMNAFQSSIANLANATYIPELKDANGKVIDAGTKRAKTSDIERVAKDVSAGSGYEKQELVDAWSAYVEKSSDSAAFVGDDPKKRASSQKFLLEMAQLAKGSGSNINDIMTAAGFLQVQNENMSAEDRAMTMRNIVGQGKLGAVSLPDLAKSVSKITATSGQFAMGTTAAQRSLLGLSQIAIQTAGTAPEAATAVANLMAEAGGGKQKKIEAKWGVKVRDEKGRIRDPAEWMSEIMGASKGDMSAINKMFGERARKPLNALKTTYEEAEAAALEKDPKAKAGVAGQAAVLKKLQKFERQGYSKQDVADDLAAIQNTREEKFKRARLQVQGAIEDALLPALEAFAKVVPQITPHLVEFVQFLAANPFKGAGMLAGAAIAKEIAAQGLRDVMARALGGAGGPIAAAIIAGFMAWKAMESKIDEDSKRLNDRGQLGAAARAAIAAAENAKSPEEKAEALKNLKDIQGKAERGAWETAEGKDTSATNEAMRTVDKALHPGALGAAALNVITGGGGGVGTMLNLIDTVSAGRGGGEGKGGVLESALGLNEIGDAVRGRDAVAKKQHESLIGDLDALGKAIRRVVAETPKSPITPMSDRTSPTS